MRASVHSQVEPVADAAAAPITIRRRREALLGGFLLAIAGLWILLAIAGLWIAVPLRRLLLDTSAAVPDLGVPGTILAILIGAALALLAVSWIVRCQVLVIDQGLVRMTDQRLSGNRVWEEPLARYHGVRDRREQRPHHDGSRSWYIIEAWHPEPAKTVELARSKDPRLIEQCAEVWARRLAPPLCQGPPCARPIAEAGARSDCRHYWPATGSVVGAQHQREDLENAGPASFLPFSPALIGAEKIDEATDKVRPDWKATGRSGFGMWRGKRLFDLVVAGGALLLIWPLFLLLATIIKLDDGGPVFFRQSRIGRHGVPFRIWKLRTMCVEAERQGGTLTVGYDPRVTRVGRWLRRTKLDELPQLINVITGEMSLVGPRPEVARHVAAYPYDVEERRVFEIVPGMTGAASIAFRNEGNLLAEASDPEAFYAERIMAEKIRLNLVYAARASLLGDIALIMQTVFPWRWPTSSEQQFRDLWSSSARHAQHIRQKPVRSIATIAPGRARSRSRP